jgi:cysteine desulfurase/selenocysteine lyase
VSDTRLYFDNSATSYPKPPGVSAAVQDYFERVHASAGRGAYREALESERIIAECRNAVRDLFSCRPEDHVIFAFNGTDALNIALKGTIRRGDHVVTTSMDHNSVLRPLTALARYEGVEWTPVDVDPQTTQVDPGRLAAAIRPDTRLAAINHASNVTGVLQPLEEIAGLCREKGVLLLVDAAQSAGHVPIDFSRLPIDLLACPGHKGLLGPLGTGVLVIRAGVEQQMRTTREGGTGTASGSAAQPLELPDRFEAGSHNALGLAGMLAGLRWLKQRGVAAVRAHEVELCGQMMEELDGIDGLRWFGPRRAEHRVGVFSVRIGGIAPAELSALLESRCGILSRSGLHCAPLAHRTIGTLADGGTTRLSAGVFTTLDEVSAVAGALSEIAHEASMGRSVELARTGH